MKRLQQQITGKKYYGEDKYDDGVAIYTRRLKNRIGNGKRNGNKQNLSLHKME